MKGALVEKWSAANCAMIDLSGDSHLAGPPPVVHDKYSKSCARKAIPYLAEYTEVGYHLGMKLKTSVTLSEDLVKMVDRAAAKGEARSQVLERLLREALAARARREADKRDRDLLNRHADALNAEVEDALRYQADL